MCYLFQHIEWYSSHTISILSHCDTSGTCLNRFVQQHQCRFVVPTRKWGGDDLDSGYKNCLTNLINIIHQNSSIDKICRHGFHVLQKCFLDYGEEKGVKGIIFNSSSISSGGTSLSALEACDCSRDRQPIKRNKKFKKITHTHEGNRSQSH